MPQKEVKNCQTFYQHIGKSSKTILLLHGWRNDWQAWSSLVPVLSGEYSLIIPDLPGFGRSGSPTKGWSTEEYVDWLIAFLRQLEVTELEAVIGHSYGGKLASFGWLSAATQLPLVRQGLFLISPSGVPNSLPLTSRLLKQGLGLVPKSLKRGILVPWRQKLYQRIDPDADYLRATPFQEDTLNLILKEDIRQLVTKPSAMPLRLCWGDSDQALPADSAYEWLKLSRHSHVFIVPGAGHFPHHEQPELFNAWLNTWLNQAEIAADLQTESSSEDKLL